MRPTRFHLLLVCLVGGLLAACSPAPEAPTGPMARGELLARMDAGDAPLVLDVRTEAEYAGGHIPGALNIPHDALAERLAVLGDDRDREIVVHCRSGRRAALAETVLVEAGYTHVRHLDGDILGWRADGYPLVAESSP